MASVSVEHLKKVAISSLMLIKNNNKTISTELGKKPVCAIIYIPVGYRGPLN